MSFSDKKSKSVVDAGREKWTANFKQRGTKRRPNLPVLNKDISDLCKMPLTKEIIGRFLGLFAELKDRQKRTKKISDELIQLWQKLSLRRRRPGEDSEDLEKTQKTWRRRRRPGEDA